MGHAEIIPLDDVRANHHRRQLRQRLHDCFDRWLDTLESSLDTLATTLPDLSTVIAELRQDLMGSLMETVIEHRSAAEIEQTRADCPRCQHSLKVRRKAVRTVETLMGPVTLRRPYFYCTACREGFHPLEPPWR